MNNDIEQAAKYHSQLPPHCLERAQAQHLKTMIELAKVQEATIGSLEEAIRILQEPLESQRAFVICSNDFPHHVVLNNEKLAERLRKKFEKKDLDASDSREGLRMRVFYHINEVAYE